MITSTHNRRIQDAHRLLRRRHRHAEQRLLLEGVRLIADALATGTTPEALFYAPELTAGNPTAEHLLRQLDRLGVESTACTPAVLRALTETVTPQGLVAVVPFPRLPAPAHPTLTLILDQVRDPGNAGTLARTAAAAGVDLVLCGPETVDPFNDKSLRAGMGAHFRVPLRVCDGWETLDGLIDPAQQIYLADAGAPVLYDAVDWTQPAALIVGGEAAGASLASRRRGQAIAIPMAAVTESLNAAVAGAVILFEAARQRRREW
jgi:TrmH family RNA methyltransferase